MDSGRPEWFNDQTQEMCREYDAEIREKNLEIFKLKAKLRNCYTKSMIALRERDQIIESLRE